MRVNQSTNKSSKPTNFTVHNIILLDASGSMSWDQKYENAKAGVFKELELCKQLGYTFTLIEFVERNKIVKHYFKVNPNEFSKLIFAGSTGYNTPLYQTIVETIEELLSTKSSTDRFLIKVLTDGQNNVNSHTASDAYNAIKKMEKAGGTVTFTCTTQDKYHVQLIGVDDSNIITYNNTGEDLERTMRGTYQKTLEYDANLRAGKNVTLGFYKTLNNEQ